MELDIQPVSEKRQFVRIPFKEAVQYQHNDWEVFDGSVAGDLSTGGIRLNINEFMPINTPMIVQMAFDEEAKLVTVNGRVAWVSIMPYCERYQIGVEFEPLHTPSRQEIHQYINTKSLNV